jgi:lipoate-protein ligase A
VTVAGALVLIVDAPAPGAVNMRRDQELQDRVLEQRDGGAVRLYGFSPPCLSLGRSQSEDDVDLEACARDGVDVVRRPTGGRAVLHDAEVTYSVTCHVTDPAFGGGVMESCGRIHTVVADALGALDVATMPQPGGRPGAPGTAPRDPDCFAHPAPGELLDHRGRKLVGSAQARRAGALLQHGSILLAPSRAARYLRRTSDRLSDEDQVPESAGPALRPDLLIDALVAAFQRRLGARLRTT